MVDLVSIMVLVITRAIIVLSAALVVFLLADWFYPIWFEFYPKFKHINSDNLEHEEYEDEPIYGPFNLEIKEDW